MGAEAASRQPIRLGVNCNAALQHTKGEREAKFGARRWLWELKALNTAAVGLMPLDKCKKHLKNTRALAGGAGLLK